jgi:pumilio family protein 6
MIHSRDGARVAIYCLWYGTNKDRKLLIKSFKSFIVKIAKEEQGYPVLWTIFDIVDDTKLVSKMILQVNRRMILFSKEINSFVRN